LKKEAEVALLGHDRQKEEVCALGKREL